MKSWADCGRNGANTILRVYLTDIKKSLYHLFFLFPVIIIFIVLLRCMYINNLFNLAGVMDRLTMITYPSALSGFTPFAAIFPLIPYATSFVDDLQSGYIKSILMRTGIKRYSRMRMMSVALSGGLTIFLPFFMIFAIITIIGIPTTSDNVSEVFLNLIWSPYVTVGGGILVMAAKLVLAFLFGAVWALFGLLMSTIVSNRYVTIIAPFVIYQALWILMPPQVNPLIFLRGDLGATDSFIGSYWFVVLLQCTIIALLSAATAYGIKRKVVNG